MCGLYTVIFFKRMKSRLFSYYTSQKSSLLILYFKCDYIMLWFVVLTASKLWFWKAINV